MTALVEREAIARIVDPRAFSEPFLEYLATRRRDALTKADAILALRQPGAEYRRGIDDAARVCLEVSGLIGAQAGSSIDSALCQAAAAIHTLSDSIPDTKL